MTEKCPLCGNTIEIRDDGTVCVCPVCGINAEIIDGTPHFYTEKAEEEVRTEAVSEDAVSEDSPLPEVTEAFPKSKKHVGSGVKLAIGTVITALSLAVTVLCGHIFGSIIGVSNRNFGDRNILKPFEGSETENYRETAKTLLLDAYHYANEGNMQVLDAHLRAIEGHVTVEELMYYADLTGENNNFSASMRFAEAAERTSEAELHNEIFSGDKHYGMTATYFAVKAMFSPQISTLYKYLSEGRYNAVYAALCAFGNLDGLNTYEFKSLPSVVTDGEYKMNYTYHKDGRVATIRYTPLSETDGAEPDISPVEPTPNTPNSIVNFTEQYYYDQNGLLQQITVTSTPYNKDTIYSKYFYYNSNGSLRKTIEIDNGQRPNTTREETVTDYYYLENGLPASEVITVTDPDTRAQKNYVRNYSYTAWGALSKESYALRETYEDTILYEHNYVYSYGSRLPVTINKVTPEEAVIVALKYDPNGLLLCEIVRSSKDNINRYMNYSYDPLGNLISVIEGSDSSGFPLPPGTEGAAPIRYSSYNAYYVGIGGN